MKKVARAHSRRYEEVIAEDKEVIAEDKQKRHNSRSWGFLAFLRQSSASAVLFFIIIKHNCLASSVM